MAKWLKEGIDAGGFAMYIKKRGGGSKGNTMGAACTHLLSFLILKKRQHWERISHWFDLKGKRKGGTQKKTGKENKDITLFQGNKIHLSVWIKECLPKRLYLTRFEETQS